MGLNGVNKPRSVQAIPGGTSLPDKPIDSMDFSPKVVIMIHHGEDLDGTGGWGGGGGKAICCCKNKKE